MTTTTSNSGTITGGAGGVGGSGGIGNVFTASGGGGGGGYGTVVNGSISYTNIGTVAGGLEAMAGPAMTKTVVPAEMVAMAVTASLRLSPVRQSTTEDPLPVAMEETAEVPLTRVGGLVETVRLA
ncbi:hypothetical protein [Reyranella sp.]|uniref:hypothetical protein n=1 Tax=Reyranella sp. TaxID=1929291 RepID=UPI003C7BFEA2